MSDVWDSIVTETKKVGKAAGKIAGDVIDYSRLKLKETKLNSEISDAYERLGAVVYNGKKSGNLNEKLIDMIISEIDSLTDELNKLTNDQNAAAQDDQTKEASAKVCDACGEGNSEDSNFCSNCGKNLKED